MNQRTRIFSIIFLLLLCPCAAFGMDSATTGPIRSIERQALNPSREMLDLGENVASTACADCHGMDGVSTDPERPHLAGQRVVYLYRVLQAYQKRERRNDAMNHAIGFLNDDALLAVAAYYASLAPARPAPAAEVTADAGEEPPENAGRDPFAGIRADMKKCVKCHGEDGNASGSGMPNLTAQEPKYFVASMKGYIEGGRDHRLMSKLAGGLDDETLYKMGVYYAVQTPKRTETAGDGNADLGRELSESCAACHGDDGNAASADMPTLAGQDARYFVKAMEAYREGKRQNDTMFGAVDPLSEEDVANLAAFYAQQEPVRRNVRTPLTTAEWIDRCDRCHGIDGNSTDPRFPMLAGQHRDYLESALRDYIGETRSNSAMHAMSLPLSEADIQGIVEFFATREPKSVVYMQLPCEDLADD